MYCPECGNQNPDSARFCMTCGYNYTQPTSFVTSSQVSSKRQEVIPSNSKNTASSTGILLLFGFLGIVAIVSVVGLAVFYLIEQQGTSTTYNQPSHDTSNETVSRQPELQPTYDTSSETVSKQSEPQQAQPQSQQIVSQSFSLKAGELKYYNFKIPDSSSSGTISGNFVASGGGNDIYVIITDEFGITNIKNRNSYKAYYDSGKVTTDNLNINLSPGTYYIVFSNAHSLMTPKAVDADIKVTY